MSAGPRLASQTAVLAPRGLAELVEALAQTTARSRLLAGGTDLVRAMRWDGLRPDLIVALGGVPELTGVRRDGERLRVGAMTTFADLQRDATVLAAAPCLAQAAAAVGSLQIRNIATIGGNIANASPCGDTMPALLALQATLGVLRADGCITERPLAEVLTGYETTSLMHDEAIVDISFTAPGAACLSAFAKIGSRTTVTVARLSMAVVVARDADSGLLAAPCIGLGALGETAFREERLEAFLDGRRADAETARLFSAECAAAVRRAIPGRYSLPYKQAAAVGLAADAWRRLGFGGGEAGGDRR